MIGWIIFGLFILFGSYAAHQQERKEREEKEKADRERSRADAALQATSNKLREARALLDAEKRAKATAWARFREESQAHDDLYANFQSCTQKVARLKQSNADLKRENRRLKEELDSLKDASVVYREVVQQGETDGGTSSLLQHALSHRNDACAEILIAAGCEINACSSQRETALHAAAHRNRPVFCQKLIDMGAAFNCATDRGKRPLHCAAEQNSVESAEVLMNAGALIDVRDNDRNTPLHCACRYGSYDVAKVLVERRCSMQLFNSAGQDPHDCFLQSTEIPAKKKAILKPRFEALLHVPSDQEAA